MSLVTFEIVVIDPNYVEYDNDYNSSPTSSDFSSSKDVSINDLDEISVDDLIFSKDFNGICTPIEAYWDPVDELNSILVPEPISPELIGISAQNYGVLGDQPLEGSYNDKPPTSKSNDDNDILFERNLIENTKRMKTSPLQEKKRLNLQEYYKRRPGLKLNLSKKLENNKELIYTANDTNQSKSEQGHTLNSTIHDMYEEIIVESIGSNTDLSIDPKDDTLSDELRLIKEMTDTDSKQITSHSLIWGIRDVITKKINILSSSNNGTEPDHAEDKTIMHLEKDRLRVKQSSIGIQTDTSIRFPRLESLDKSKINVDSKSFSRSRSTSTRSSHNSDASETRKRKPSTSPSSRYTVSRNKYSRNGSKQGLEQSHKRGHHEADERCTVYVGRIETTTSKNDLMKKFLRYGEIRDVTTHQKENGLKFGFVTFKSAKDAYNTIDASANDTAINMYDISFGGRRAFCKETYFDLNNADLHQQTYVTNRSRT